MRKSLIGSFQLIKKQNNEGSKKVIEQLLKTKNCNEKGKAHSEVKKHSQGEGEKIFNLKTTVIELQKKNDLLKKQTSQDLLALKSMMEAFGQHIHKLKELENSQQNKLMKGQQNVKLLKNEAESLRDLLEKQVKFHKEEANNFGKTIELLLREFQFRRNEHKSE